MLRWSLHWNVDIKIQFFWSCLCQLSEFLSELIQHFLVTHCYWFWNCWSSFWNRISCLNHSNLHAVCFPIEELASSHCRVLWFLRIQLCLTLLELLQIKSWEMWNSFIGLRKFSVLHLAILISYLPLLFFQNCRVKIDVDSMQSILEVDLSSTRMVSLKLVLLLLRENDPM